MHIFRKQSKPQGFTIIELLVVMAIMGIMAAMVSNFNFNKKTEIEKRDRIIEAIINLIDKAKWDSLVGRAVQVSGNLINPASTKVSITANQIAIQYFDTTAAQIGTGETLSAPFYGESGYKIESITDEASSPINSIEFRGTAAELSSSGSYSVKIKAGYNSSLKIIEFDKRTGRIQIK